MPFGRSTGSIDGQALTDGNIIARNVVGISQCRRCDAVAVSDAVERIAFSNHIELGGGDWCIGRAPCRSRAGGRCLASDDGHIDSKCLTDAQPLGAQAVALHYCCRRDTQAACHASHVVSAAYAISHAAVVLR